MYKFTQGGGINRNLYTTKVDEGISDVSEEEISKAVYDFLKKHPKLEVVSWYVFGKIVTNIARNEDYIGVFFEQYLGIRARPHEKVAATKKKK